MKVVQINTTVNTGSTGRITEEIGEKIMEAGHESYIAYGKKRSNPSKSKLIKIGSVSDRYIHAGLTRLFDLHGFGSKGSTEKLIDRLYKIDPDVIGLHNLHGYYINIEILFNYLKEVQKPVVWTLFDCWAFTGHCTYFDSIGCERWIDGCYSCPKKTRYPASYGLDNSKLNYKRKKELFTGLNNLTIVAHSHWLAGLVKRSFLKEYPVKVIRSGIDLDNFSIKNEKPQVLNGITKKIVLGVASTWSDRKGLSDFIELDRSLNNDFQIVLIGIDKNLKKILPADIISVPRTESVHELAEFYSAADVFVNPTTADNFPTTNLESLACGTPVITYETGGSPEAIDRETGIVIDKNDTSGLTNAVKKITEKEKEFYTTVCRSRALRLFNKNERYKDYLNLFNQSKIFSE